VSDSPQELVARRKVRQGIVVSDARDKTVTVRIDGQASHPMYKKTVRRSNKLHVHDERNEAGIGDLVRIIETRPLSKQKRWRLAEIIERAK
jgi:small subunit ribosomal protein S17